MAYTVPTLNQYRKRFPEHDLIDDEIIKTALSDATRVVGTNWTETDYPTGILLLAAHYVEGGPEGSLGGAQIQGESLGPISVSYYRGQRPSGYDTTSYGIRFAQLLAVNVRGPLVV